jgi:hypothetical protein
VGPHDRWFAGNDRGGYALPEVDDEVLVAVELGDIHAPYVLGGLWNGVDKPPRDNADGANNVRVIRSRSGHELIFNDEQQKEQVELHTKAGHTILLDDSAARKVPSPTRVAATRFQIARQNAVTIARPDEDRLKALNHRDRGGSMMTIRRRHATSGCPGADQLTEAKGVRCPQPRWETRPPTRHVLTRAWQPDGPDRRGAAYTSVTCTPARSAAAGPPTDADRGRQCDVLIGGRPPHGGDAPPAGRRSWWAPSPC